MGRVYINLLCAAIILFLSFSKGSGQLVTKRDYKAAIALQAGAETGLLLPGASPEFKINPAFGLKMTFPFDRKWFMGSEINYNDLKTGNSHHLKGSASGTDIKTSLKLHHIQVPLYIKYMLNCNRASVLFGAYASYLYDSDYSVSGGDTGPDSDPSDMFNPWGFGLVAGYEQQLAKRLNLTLKVSGGLLSTTNDKNFFGQKGYPLQTSLTLSYDILRIGDCGCN